MERLRHCLVILILAAAIPGCAGHILDDPGTSQLRVTTVELRITLPDGEVAAVTAVEGGSASVDHGAGAALLEVRQVEQSATPWGGDTVHLQITPVGGDPATLTVVEGRSTTVDLGYGPVLVEVRGVDRP